MQKNHDSHAKESDSEQTILQGHVEMDSTEDSNMCTRHNCSTQPDGERGGNFASSIDDEINHTSESPFIHSFFQQGATADYNAIKTIPSSSTSLRVQMGEIDIHMLQLLVRFIRQTWFLTPC